MTARRKKRADVLRPAVGDKILVASYASRPHQWFFANVLWIDGDEVLISHEGQSKRESYRSVIDIDGVVAIGTTRELIDFAREAQAAAFELGKAVSEAEEELGRAREAMWAAIDELPQTIRARRLQPTVQK